MKQVTRAVSGAGAVLQPLSRGEQCPLALTNVGFKPPRMTVIRQRLGYGLAGGMTKMSPLQ